MFSDDGVQDARVETWRKEAEALRARVAALEEVARDREKDVTLLRERLTAAEDGNRELVRRAQKAETERDQWKATAETWFRRVEIAADELADIGTGEFGRLDLVARIRRFRDPNAPVTINDPVRRPTLSAAGQVLSGHVGGAECHACDMDLMCIACDQCTPHRWQPSPDAGPGWRCSECSTLSKSGRYPCSSTCTHDDASTPGHAERVKERSEAVVREVNAFVGEALGARRALCDAMERLGFDGAVMFRDTSLDIAALGNAMFQSVRDEEMRVATGASEAMRAACWDAVQEELRRMGIVDPGVAVRLKSAIEGAAP